MAKERTNDRDCGPRDLGWALLSKEAFAREQAEAPASKRSDQLRASRRAMERAALELSGEVGYGQMTVEALLERSDSNRERFYHAYQSKAECYTAGYSAAIDQLAERLLSAGADAPSWSAGFRTACEELARVVAAEPVLARGLLAEVYAAGDAALEKRKEVFERLSRTIDRARRETDESRHSPPPFTPRFILSGIEAATLRALREESYDFEEILPGLIYISVSFYFGREAAAAETRRLGRAG
ncbi:MAG: TetR/AcrR family transcriptional regulator [Solirubrobacterales bacterium]|nr:TetR/AcrR family transcriptional regulator [Solirubrobacterales bacterium]